MNYPASLFDQYFGTDNLNLLSTIIVNLARKKVFFYDFFKIRAVK